MKGASRADLEWWLDLAPRLSWTFAATMPGTPHWYIHRDQTEGLTREDFERAVRVTRTFGEPGKFYSFTNLYLFADGRLGPRTLKFWTQGAPIEETFILNLATTEKNYGEQANFDEDVLTRLRLPLED
ncbi:MULTISPECIES: hypothetical protein [unclassified Knoellia]|uniref:hypothetical protein n=1 Tax=Knoellia altitudinis TaxID=3404795 RepID=UPI0036170B4C